MKPQEYVLKGSEFVPLALIKVGDNPKLLWVDIRDSLRATEERVRNANAASNPTWLKQHLSWFGCRAAIPMGEVFLPCHRVPQENGFCKSHKKRAN